MTSLPPLTGADAWNESGNLLLGVAPNVLVWPASMIGSLAIGLVDARWVRKMTIAIVIVLVIFMFYFFRNPAIDRSDYGRLGQYDMVAPSCGMVLAINQVPMDQVEADYGPLVSFQQASNGTGLRPVLDKAAWRVCIGLSLLDKHYQCMPFDAAIQSINYKQGTFAPALLLEKSEMNERAIIQLVPPKQPDGSPAPVASCYMVLLAGMIARTITTFANCEPGASLSRGAKIGMIQFGSRVDVIIPFEYNIRVVVGQQVEVGQTVLATLS